MNERVGGAHRRIAPLVVAAALFSLVFASASAANNLDVKTMTEVAREVAKLECKDTRGCKDWRTRGLHRVTKHKGLGKIELTVVRDGTKFACRQQIVIKLNHVTGEILYGLSRRNCDTLA